MAAARTLAALLLLVIVGSSVADAARTASMVQQQRKLLTTTTTWGTHHTGEVCYTDDLITSLVKPLLRQIKVYLDANLQILCIDVLYAELSGLSPLLLVDKLPLKSTKHCSALVNAHVTVQVLDLNVHGLVSTVPRALEKIVVVKGIFGDNGKGKLLFLEVELSSGRKKSWGKSTAVGLKLDLEVGLLESLLGCPTKFCRYNGGIGLLEFLLGLL